MTVLHLIRHAETDWNAQRRWQGHADVPLNAAGRLQVKLAVQRYQHELRSVGAVYSSDLSRAVDTAAPLAAQLGLQLVLRPALREIDLGGWSGKTYEEIAVAFPAEVAALAAGEDIRRGGGESVAMLLHRIVSEIEALAALHPAAEIAVVTHGGCIRMALAYAEGRDAVELSHHVAVENTSLTSLQISAAGWSLLRVNDHRHLNDAALHSFNELADRADD
jgi:broad specificity phosphatase PhoE